MSKSPAPNPGPRTYRNLTDSSPSPWTAAAAEAAQLMRGHITHSLTATAISALDFT
ncbi:hypothetical protein [Streptomyces galilaeus]|uniref:hypothetical protein n=1 Tax=Streptomyces galilaeus TaxID=33899 RepID=UPI0038F60C04